MPVPYLARVLYGKAAAIILDGAGLDGDKLAAADGELEKDPDRTRGSVRIGEKRARSGEAPRERLRRSKVDLRLRFAIAMFRCGDQVVRKLTERRSQSKNANEKSNAPRRT